MAINKGYSYTKTHTRERNGRAVAEESNKKKVVYSG